MRFGAPHLLPWLLVALACCWGLWRYRLWQRHQLHLWTHPRFIRHIWQQHRSWRMLVSDLTLGLGLLLLTLALARPQWGSQPHNISRKGLDIAVILDISASMKQKDTQPSRWQRSILELVGFCNQLGGDRLALINFAGESGLLTPLTDDYTALRQLAWSSRPGTFSEKGPGLSQALQTASSLLKRRNQQSQAQVVIILTDGDPQATSTSITQRARQLAAQGVYLFVVNVGPNGTTTTNALRAIAQTGKGYYLTLRSAGFGLRAIANALQPLKRNQRDKKQQTKPKEQFPLFLLFGCCLLVASRFTQPL